MSTIADYIITLAGKNPTPDYYSILNYSKDNTKVFIVYTQENTEDISSEIVCNNISKAVKKKIKGIDISPIPCEKSNIIKIKKTAENIFNEIFIDCDYENLGNRKINIIVDYTGATKSMAMVFYNYFKTTSDSNKYDKLVLHSSYVSSEKEEIYECSFESVNLKYTYEINDIINFFSITITDLIELHGYKLANNPVESFCIVRENDDMQKHKIMFSNIGIKNCNLIFDIDISVKKIKNLVDKYFEISDAAEKIGGSEALVNFNVKDYKLEQDFDDYAKAEQKFYDSLNNVYDLDLKEKVKINFTE